MLKWSVLVFVLIIVFTPSMEVAAVGYTLNTRTRTTLEKFDCVCVFLPVMFLFRLFLWSWFGFGLVWFDLQYFHVSSFLRTYNLLRMYDDAVRINYVCSARHIVCSLTYVPVVYVR